MTEDQTPGMGPKEVERSNYAALVKSLAGTLDLRGGLSEAIDIVDYTAMSGHIASFLDLEAGLQSALAVSTQADAEVPLRASVDATDSVTDVLLRIGDGDAAAWDKILIRYGKLVSRTVQSFGLQEADALDAVQMTWLRLAENVHRIKFPEQLGGWLATTACRECLRILRQDKPVQDVIGLPPATVADPSADPDKDAIGADTAQTLRKFVAELPPDRQALIWMLLTANPPSYAEVSRVTGIPLGAIGPTRARALRQLRAKLNEHTLGQGGVAKDVEGINERCSTKIGRAHV